MSSQGKKKVSKIDVKYVADLIRISLSDEEQKQFESQLEDILEYINKLNEVDTRTVEPTSHVLPLKNIFREDKAGPSLKLDEVLKNAPLKSDDSFKVPKIVE